MESIDVYADISCPFTHVGLQRFVARRSELGGGPRLRLRPWPLELVNGAPLTGLALAPKIEALRRDVAPELFAGFDPYRFPATTLPALAAEAAAHAVDPATGEELSLALRHALFEDGADPSDETVLGPLLRDRRLPMPSEADLDEVRRSHEEGVRRGVAGSPHFFTASGDFFCPSLDIAHGDDGYSIAFNTTRFETFMQAAFG